MSYSMMFYNLENLYDVADDPKTDDEEFTPQGNKQWTLERYHCKLKNLSEVIASVASSFGGFPSLIGVSEVENIKVMQDLASQKRIGGAHYKVIHFESNDIRGVDVGLFYRPDIFNLISAESVKLVLRSGREYIGRNILHARGTVNGEMFAIYVCHFLSRRAGVAASAGFRRAGAETVRDHAAKLREQFPEIKVVVMGDMNDTPSDESLARLLKARKSIHSVPEGEYFNPFWALQDEGKGSSLHSHRWVLYDNIIVSHNLLPTFEEVQGLRIVKTDQKHYGDIFRKNFMLSKGAPKRCYYGNNFSSGYSDHLPVVIKLDTK